MKTEIRFLLDLVLEHKLPPEAKKLCLERIGEVETSLQRVPLNAPAPFAIGAAAKSSAQLKYEAEVAAGSAPPLVGQVPIPAAPLAPPISNRVVGGEVNTGGGTRGPRKF